MVGGSGPGYSEQLVSPYQLHGSGGIQDPRQQKLLMEQQQQQQRVGMGGALKPTYTKQVKGFKVTNSILPDTKLCFLGESPRVISPLSHQGQT